MRTTLTLDDDLATRLRELAHKRNLSFRSVVNELLRRGLSAPERGPGTRKRYRVETFRSAFRPGIDPLRLNQLVDDLEVRRIGGSS